MSLERWELGEQITKTKLNAMVDKTNIDQTRIDTLETAVAGKPDLCSDNPEDTGTTPSVGIKTTASPCDHKHRAVGSDSPEDVADSASVGSETLASRQDHVHEGVHKIVAGTNVTISPSSGLGDVTVNAAAAAGGVTRVELPFSGTYSAGDTIVSDTPATDKLLVALYMELTTVSGGFMLVPIFNAQEASSYIKTAGDYAWLDASGYIIFKSDDTRRDYGPLVYGWKLGYSIELKCTVAGTASGKLVIYYAAIT